eukprot:Seg190.1 transcript_id=Seg190.1/GoldUCD/mRNA.D3Y31 product="hypothetical protein" protein_id=Seg190.1/GoldUCD/D3Y31
MFKQQNLYKSKILFGVLIAAFIVTYTRYLSQNIFQKIKPYDVVANVDGSKFHRINNTEEFISQWCRISKARADWKSILAPCAGFLSWDSRKTLNSSLETDAQNSFVAWQDIRPAREISRIFLSTRLKNGSDKTIGGDSWRVRINGTATINAHVIDHKNGTYEIVFVCMDEGVYFVYILLDYTLCNGLRDPPENWFRKGNSQGKYQGINAIGKPKDFLMHPLKDMPFKIEVRKRRMDITHEAPECSDNCNLFWDGLGRWRNLQWIPYFPAKHFAKKKNSRLEGKGNLLVYGDSVAVFFAQSLQRRRKICGGIFKACRYSYNWVYEISNVTLARNQRDGLDMNITRIIKDFNKTIQGKETNKKHSVVIVNFGLHFVESTNFSNYKILIDDFVKLAMQRNAQGKLLFKGKFIWKTTTAIYKERADFPQLHWRRFFTNYRIQLFNAYATDMMCRHQIPVIDAYPISATYPFGTGTHAGRTATRNDIVHYNNEAFYPIETFLEKNVHSLTNFY